MRRTAGAPRPTLLAVAVALTTAAPVSGQGWSLHAETGRIASTLDPGAASSPLGLGFGAGYDAAAQGVRLTLGVPIGPDRRTWGSAAGWKRAAVRRGPLVAGLDLAGSAYLSRTSTPVATPSPLFPDPLDAEDGFASAFAGQLLPVLGYEASAVRVHARAGVSHYASHVAERRTSRTVRLAELQLTLAPSPSLALAPVVRRFQAHAEEPVHQAAVSAALGDERLRAWGSVGRWFGSEEGLSWDAGASLALHSRVKASAAVRRQTLDPLYQGPAQTAWSLGLSVRLGPAAPDLPTPAAYAAGRATLRLPLSESAEPPRIAGDFNGWTPAPMVRTDEGWSYSIALAPGVYHYAFVKATGEWYVPESVAGRKPDGMGGYVAVLVVP